MGLLFKIKNILNFLKTSDLSDRLIQTLLLITLFRLGGFIFLPGVNEEHITRYTDGLLGLLDVFLGGAFSNLSIFGLGVMPYISASIITHLSTLLFPSFKKIQMDGQSGRVRLNQITKYLTIFIAIIHSVAFMSYSVTDKLILINKYYFIFIAAFILTAGSMFCVWIGERITDNGLGQGISMLIFVGIVSSLPSAVYNEYCLKKNDIVTFVIEMLALFIIIILTTAVHMAVRKVTLVYINEIIEYRKIASLRQYFPIKMISAGVMPIIFAQVLIFFIAFIFNLLSKYSELATNIYTSLSDNMSWGYNITFAILIIIFTFLYIAINFNTMRIAEDLKRSSAIIPGVKPGTETAKHIDKILLRTVTPGAIILAVIALLPAVAYSFGVDRSLGRFYGGTTLLIIIPVVYECISQINSFWIHHKYSEI